MARRDKTSPKKGGDGTDRLEPLSGPGGSKIDARELAESLRKEIQEDGPKKRKVQKVGKPSRQGAPPPIPEEAGVLPQVVADRMLNRMLTFAGIPLFLGILLFVSSFVLAYKYDVRFIPTVVANATLLTVFTSFAGLTYGIFSASWDVKDEGSRLGLVEARRNLLRAYDAVVTNRDKEKRNDERGRS